MPVLDCYLCTTNSELNTDRTRIIQVQYPQRHMANTYHYHNKVFMITVVLCNVFSNIWELSSPLFNVPKIRVSPYVVHFTKENFKEKNI
jgi:hypothetical protein